MPKTSGGQGAYAGFRSQSLMALDIQPGGLFLWALIPSGAGIWQLCNSRSSECLQQAKPGSATAPEVASSFRDNSSISIMVSIKLLCLQHQDIRPLTEAWAIGLELGCWYSGW